MSLNIVSDVIGENFVSLKDKLEKKVAEKVYSRIQDKKAEVLASINKIPKAQMVDLISAAAAK